MNRAVAAAAGLVLAGWGPVHGQSVVERSLERDLTYLAAPALEGRFPGSPGGDSAAVYIARTYAGLGLDGAFPENCEPGVRCGAAFFQVFQVDGMRAENVVTTIEGYEPTLANRWIVIGAHYDHLERLNPGRWDPDRPWAGVRPGADDNASGTAAVMEITRRLSRRRLPMSVMVTHFDAEELGLVGSRVFVDNPPIPLDSIVVMVNLDMVGRLEDDRLGVEFTSRAAGWQPVLDSVAEALDMPVRSRRPRGIRSDHASFHERDVPAIHLFTGVHEDYHRESDTVDRLDIAGIARVVDYTEALLRAVGAVGR